MVFFLMCAFCFGLSVFRCYLTHTHYYLFLNWNLFLAILPWVFSSALIRRKHLRENKWTLVLLVGTWLLFFPNSPYILTDLFHLRNESTAPIWFDLILILSFAWTGLMFGFQSLSHIEGLLGRYFKPAYLRFISILLLFTGSFGVYIGRYLRWNSWDMLYAPASLMSDIGERLVDPASFPRTWGMTILMGSMLNLMYWSVKKGLESNVPDLAVSAENQQVLD